MEVSDNEGLANHVVPESCAVCRETCGESYQRGIQIPARERLVLHAGQAFRSAHRRAAIGADLERTVNIQEAAKRLLI